MLNKITFEVFNKILDGDVYKTDCFFSKSAGRRLNLITNSAISYENFIKKTKYLVSESDVASYDEDNDYFEIDIDLTSEFMNKIIANARYICLSEFDEMKK